EADAAAASRVTLGQIDDPHIVRADVTGDWRLVTGDFSYCPHRHRWHRPARPRVVPRELPAIVAAASVDHDVAGYVLDDQVLAPHAEMRAGAESERVRIPPHDRIAVARERVLARAHRGRSRRLAVRAIADR